MGYSSLISKQVNKAFTMLGDLAKDIVLYEKVAIDYSFNTQTPLYVEQTTKAVKGVILRKKIPNKVSSTLQAELLIKSEDVVHPDIYDKALIEGIQWNIVPPYKNNGFTITLNLARET